jgi:hypothetical protein
MLRQTHRTTPIQSDDEDSEGALGEGAVGAADDVESITKLMTSGTERTLPPWKVVVCGSA